MTRIHQRRGRYDLSHLHSPCQRLCRFALSSQVFPALLICFASTLNLGAEESTQGRQVDTPIPVAHRGLLHDAPENTLPAFAACLELGLGFELDVRTTRDGHLVVIHDDNVQRTTNGLSRSVRDMTLAELKTLDAGSWFDPAFTRAKIPTLEEVLKLVQDRKRGPTLVALNVKSITKDGEARLVKLVEKHDLIDESFAFDQSDEMSRRLKQLNPDFRIGQNVSRAELQSRLEEGLLDDFLLTSLPTIDEVAMLHGQHKRVLFNFAGSNPTRRNPTAWTQAALSGIDGILTDYPLECRRTWRVALGVGDHLPSLNFNGVWVEKPWGKPVLNRGGSGDWDHMAVDNPYVHFEDGKYYCFFEAQDKPFGNGGREAIGIAVSNDGIQWEKLSGNPILTTGASPAWDEVVAKLPVGVSKLGETYYLFYSGRDQHIKQIGVATASNLSGPWTKHTDNPVIKARPEQWDATLSTHPSQVFHYEGRYYLLWRGMKRRYAAQGVGLSVSDNLIQWQRVTDEPVIAPDEEIASLAVARTHQGFVGISQPIPLERRTYWFSTDLRRWQKGPAVNFRASVKAETLSNPFLSNGAWTILYEQNDRIYRAILQPAP